MKTVTTRFLADALLDAVEAGSISLGNAFEVAEILADAARGLRTQWDSEGNLVEVVGLRARKAAALEGLADEIGEENGRRERLAERIAAVSKPRTAQ